MAGGAGVVEGEEVGEGLLGGERVGPGVGSEDRGGEDAMGVYEPGAFADDAEVVGISRVRNSEVGLGGRSA